MPRRIRASHPPMRDPNKSSPDAHDLRIGIVTSQYHREITSALERAARTAFVQAGGREADLVCVPAPGAFEIPVICAEIAAERDVDAIVALGCIVTGETTHDRYLAAAVAHGLTTISVTTGIPIAFGVLTVQSEAQALERAGGPKGNKGEEAMMAAVQAARTIKSLASEDVV
jgi:6,7-dimethyl-8-ribityllumazine synthase